MAWHAAGNLQCSLLLLCHHGDRWVDFDYAHWMNLLDAQPGNRDCQRCLSMCHAARRDGSPHHVPKASEMVDCVGLCINSCCCSQVIAKASDAFSAGDIVNKRVRQFQSWSLMPFAAVVGSVFPAAYMRGSRETFGLFPGEMNFPRCPSFTSFCIPR